MNHPTRVNRNSPIQDRFWARVTKSAECWVWSGKPTPKGYGRISVGGAPVLAHRFSYELHHGPIPSGLVIDHMCHVRLCVNPEHLRAVTTAANSQNRIGAQVTNVSGARGVYQSRGKWRVQLTVEGERYSAGPFSSAEKAEAVGVAMRRVLMPDSLVDHATG